MAAVSAPTDLAVYCRDVASRARAASRALASVSGGAKIEWLRGSADRLRASHKRIATANEQDLTAAPEYGLTDAQVDRLRLGLAGDWKSIGEGVFELRVHEGRGYRVYFGRDGKALVILLCGGDKSTQRRDIDLARAYWRAYRRCAGPLPSRSASSARMTSAFSRS